MGDNIRHQDDGFHEIQLNGKQLVFLFMAGAVVSVVIFLCGVLVGRGVGAARASSDPPVADAPSQPPTASTPATADPAAEPPAPAKEAADDLSYHRRLEGEGTPAEQLKPAAEAANPPRSSESKSAPPAAPPAKAGGTGPAGGFVVQVAALRDRAAADAIVRRLTTNGYPAFILDPAPGAPAQVYRVRVGRYADRREAEQVGRRLEREEQFKPIVTR